MTASSVDLAPGHGLPAAPHAAPAPPARPLVAANIGFLAAQRAVTACELAQKILDDSPTAQGANPGGLIQHDADKVAGYLAVAESYRQIAATMGERGHALAAPRDRDDQGGPLR